MARARQAPRDFHLPPRRFPAARQGSRPAHARRASRAKSPPYATRASEGQRTPPRPGPLARPSRKPAHAARHDEPHLDALLRPRPGRDRGRFRHARHARRRIRNCSTGWPREFIRRGWSLKAMHRLIVTSATYRQSSQVPARSAKTTIPRNLLLARQERVRVEAEIVRDAALSRQRPARPHDRRPERPAAAAGRRLCLHANGQEVDRRHRRQLAIAAACTRSSSAARRIRSSPRSTRRISRPSARAAAAATRRCKRSPSPTTKPSSNSRKASPPASSGRRAAARLRRRRSTPVLRRAFLLALCREPSATELATLRGYYDRQLADLTDEPDRAQVAALRRTRRHRQSPLAPPQPPRSSLVAPRHLQHRQLHHPRMTDTLHSATWSTRFRVELRNLKSSRSATRRHFFGQCGVGLGAIALNQLLARDGIAAPPPSEVNSIPPIRWPRARRPFRRRRRRTSSTSSWPAARASSSCSTTSRSSAS